MSGLLPELSDFLRFVEKHTADVLPKVAKEAAKRAEQVDRAVLTYQVVAAKAKAAKEDAKGRFPTIRKKLRAIIHEEPLEEIE